MSPVLDICLNNFRISYWHSKDNMHGRQPFRHLGKDEVIIPALMIEVTCAKLQMGTVKMLYTNIANGSQHIRTDIAGFH